MSLRPLRRTPALVALCLCVAGPAGATALGECASFVDALFCSDFDDFAADWTNGSPGIPADVVQGAGFATISVDDGEDIGRLNSIQLVELGDAGVALSELSFEISVDEVLGRTYVLLGYFDTGDSFLGSEILADFGTGSAGIFSFDGEDLNGPSTGTVDSVRLHIYVDGAGSSASYDLVLVTVPEPGAFLLVGLGILGIALVRRRRARSLLQPLPA